MKDIFKVYITFDNGYPNDEARLEKFRQAVRELGLSDRWGENKNKTDDRHYPAFYSDWIYPHPCPSVIEMVDEKDIDDFIAHFKERGFKAKVTHKYRLVTFEGLRRIFKGLENFSTLKGNEPLFVDRTEDLAVL